MSEEYSDKIRRKIEREVRKIFQLYEKSPEFSKLFKYCQKEAEFIIGLLGVTAYDYELVRPEDWTLDVFLQITPTIQKKCIEPNIFFKALPKVIMNFCEFCLKNNIGNFNAEKLVEFKRDFKDGYYDEEFYNSWEEGHEIRKKQARGWGLDF